MIDSITLVSHKYNKDNFDLGNNYIKHVISPPKNSEYYLYNIRNLTLILKRDSLKISGSLTKYFLGHNINLSIGSIKDVKDAFSKLSDELKIDLSEFTVSRLDFGRCFILSNPIIKYLKSLHSLDNHDYIYYQNTGRNFKNTVRTIAFYDKVDEIRSLKYKEIKNTALQNLRILDLEKKNILRYEVQIRDAFHHFGTIITVKGICDPYFYREKILREYFKYYDLIDKNNHMNFDFTGKKQSEIFKIMALYGIQCYNKENFYAEMKDFVKNKSSEIRLLSYHKKKNRELEKVSTNSDDLLDELTKKIEESIYLPILTPEENHLFDDIGLLVDFLATLVSKQRKKDPELNLPKLNQKWDFRDCVNWKADDTDIAFIIREEIQNIKEISIDENGVKKIIQEDGMRNTIYLMKKIKYKKIQELSLVDFLNEIMSRCHLHS